MAGMFVGGALKSAASAATASAARAAAAEQDEDAGLGSVAIASMPPMPRLRATLVEAQRLYPTSPTQCGPFLRVVADDTLPGGKVLRAGTTVLLHPFVTGRQDALWDDPEAFEPRRFLVQRHAVRCSARAGEERGMEGGSGGGCGAGGGAALSAAAALGAGAGGAGGAGAGGVAGGSSSPRLAGLGDDDGFGHGVGDDGKARDGDGCPSEVVFLPPEPHELPAWTRFSVAGAGAASQQDEEAGGLDLLTGQRRRSSNASTAGRRSSSSGGRRRSSNSSVSSDGRRSPFAHARPDSVEPPGRSGGGGGGGGGGSSEDTPLLQHGARLMSAGPHFLHHDLTQALMATMLCVVLQRVTLTLIEPDSYTYENGATLCVEGGLEVDVSGRAFRTMRSMHTIAEELDDDDDDDDDGGAGAGAAGGGGGAGIAEEDAGAVTGGGRGRSRSG